MIVRVLVGIGRRDYVLLLSLITVTTNHCGISTNQTGEQKQAVVYDPTGAVALALVVTRVWNAKQGSERRSKNLVGTMNQRKRTTIDCQLVCVS